ncbi:hypothetical protein [Nocardioides aquiterrae]|uniref:Uncharacterized protein n=1 Tax=Nocardioides aquiterrae TaxID=203799 RepID=A0ABN1UK79_9ACTN
MSTASQTSQPTFTGEWAQPIAQATVTGYGTERFTVTRATNGRQELVFIESTSGETLWLTPEQAADFAEAVHNVSGMETSTRQARFLAQVHRMAMARDGVTRAHVERATGIARHRLRRILSGEVPMTHAEHVAISEVQA